MSALREEVRTRTASLLEDLARLGLRPVFANGEYYSCSADEADSLIKRYEWSYRASGRVERSSGAAAETVGTVRTVLENQGWSITRAGMLNSGRSSVAAERQGLKLGVGLYEDLPGELLGRREVRLRLGGMSPAAEELLAAAGPLTCDGDWFTVVLPADEDATTVPGLVAHLVALGVRVHAVEPGRISLEQRLLGILRAGSGADRR
jgi:hypothetical protein